MIYKIRSESPELQIYKSLHARMNLLPKDKQYFFNLKKGFEGEVMFDGKTEKLQCDCLILNDLLLKHNSSTFQIDSLILLGEALYLFEVKNFEGDFYYESDKIYTKSRIEISNPLIQLKRTESLLRQLLQSLGFNTTVTASVVFINPEFTLYQCPQDKPFLLPTQITRNLKQLNDNPAKLNGKYKILAEKFVSLHIEESPYSQLPAYHYDLLQKGIKCEVCNSFLITVEGNHCKCLECGHKEALSKAVLRSVKEFQLLFPDQKITTNIIQDWCKVVQPKYRIRRVLERNFNPVGVHQWTYYE